MPVALYLDHNVWHSVAAGLRRRGVDVVTSQDDGTTDIEDIPLLDRARELGRVLVTFDEDFLIEGNRRQRFGDSFAGIAFARQLGISVGELIDDLELIARVSTLEDVAGQVLYLPL